MAGVHGLVYVLAGAVVTITYLALDLGSDYALFFYFSLALMAYGTLKVLFLSWRHYSMHKTTKKTMNKHLSKAQEEIAKRHPSFSGHGHAGRGKKQRFCWSCGSHITPEDRFCSKCGARLS